MSAGKAVAHLDYECTQSDALLAGPVNRVLFSCRDRSIQYIENGALRWALPSDGTLERLGTRVPSSDVVGIMDRTGTTYFLDQGRANDEGGKPATHIHALSKLDTVRWKRSYLSGGCARHAPVADCISD